MKVKFTELNSGYRGERRESFINKQNKSVITIALTLIAVFCVVFVLSSTGVLPLDALLLRAKVGLSGDDERYPLAINTDSTLDVDIIGESVVILTTENVSVYSPNGRLTFSEPHVFAKPGISVNGDRAVVFDRGGKGYFLITDKKTVHKANADNIIITAEYGSNGNYALGTKAENATSALCVYNKFNKEIFRWNCAYENIVNIALSDNGKYAGVAVVGAQNGEIFTTVQYFGFDYKEVLNTQKISGAAPFDLEFTGFNRLSLLTDNGSYIIERKEKEYKKISDYYSSEFNSCNFTDSGEHIVCLAKYASKNNFEINLYKANGKLKTTVNVNASIINTYVTDKYIFTLSEGFVTVYNFSGKEVSKINFKGEAYSVYATDDFVFITSLDKITRCFSVGDSEIEL